MRHQLGLRLRITVLAALAVGVALTIGAVFLVNILRSRLEDATTNAAELRARDIAALVDGGGVPGLVELPGEETAFVQVVDNNGRLLGSSENLEGEPPISTVVPSGKEPVASTMTVAQLEDGESTRMRVVALIGETPSGSPVIVYAGESLERSEETVSAITRALLAGVPVLVLVIAGVTWLAVGRTLRPVHAISTAMGEITATDLHRRVPRPPTNDEIGLLADAVNDTLQRLDTSVEQQRRFVADASHELRGPLASLRADLEISVTHPSVTDWTTVARDTLDDVEHLQRLAEDLLLLARLDAKQTPAFGDVELAEIVREATAEVRRDGIEITTTGLVLPTNVRGDRNELRRLVRNLVHNAEKHTTNRLDVAIERSAGLTLLTVSDDGPGIAPTDRARVFERFVRLDAARTRDAGGTGLGLAIAREIAERHHATITAADSRIGSTRGPGVSFVTRFPR